MGKVSKPGIKKKFYKKKSAKKFIKDKCVIKFLKQHEEKKEKFDFDQIKISSFLNCLNDDKISNLNTTDKKNDQNENNDNNKNIFFEPNHIFVFFEEPTSEFHFDSSLIQKKLFH